MSCCKRTIVTRFVACAALAVGGLGNLLGCTGGVEGWGEGSTINPSRKADARTVLDAGREVSGDEAGGNSSDGGSAEVEPSAGDADTQVGEPLLTSDANVAADTTVPVAVCGNGVVEGDEQCDDGNDSLSDGCIGCVSVPVCGDGRTEGDEECDSQDPNECDRCQVVPPAVCGDGVVEGDEECDSEHEVCVDCVITLCGDGVVQGAEACDDGNSIPDDGCDNACNKRRCGDRRVQDGETCDPPGTACSDTCQVIPQNCGDGELQLTEGEQCDDGNAAEGDGCFQCQLECGNGRVEPEKGETCELGTAFLDCQVSNVDLCLSCEAGTVGCERRDICDPLTCTKVAACGNGELETYAGEACEPPGSASCDNFCQPRSFECGNDVVELGEQCDPPLSGECSPACKHLKCGDGVVTGSEECDPPNTATCDASCRAVLGCEPTGAPGNLLPNGGTFSSGFAGWAAQESRVMLSHVSDDGADEQGALRVGLDNGGPGGAALEARGATLCLLVAANTVYQFTGQYRFEAATPTDSGTSVMLFLFTNADCSGAPVEPASSRGPKGAVSTSWAPYSTSVSTAVLPADASARSMLVRLDVWRPSALASVSVLWDDVRLSAESNPEGAACGDCVVDDAEQCDDGNQTNGDGCSARCTFEGECLSCAADECGSELGACFKLDGSSEAGASQSQLCGELFECVQRTGCALDTAVSTLEGRQGATATIENCYCGTARGEACLQPGSADGSCKAEVEGALGTQEPALVFQRFSGADDRYPAFAAASVLWQCTQASGCTACASDLSCGDGIIQERSAEFFLTDQPGTFIPDVSGSEVLTCQSLALAGADPVGCFFEACDDGNNIDGDGCDARCYPESPKACGNGVLQIALGETCDDGNRTDGDGCGVDCDAEWACGNGVVEGNEFCDDGNVDDGDGCDAQCWQEVCGNGKVQPQVDEVCDPPNGSSCTEVCQLGVLDECTQCVFDLDPYSPDAVRETNCGGLAFLDVSPFVAEGDFNGLRCLANPACSALWFCLRESRCVSGATGRGQPNHECYCGEGVELATCVDPGFAPQGACSEQMVQAYEEQIGRPPDNNQQLIESTYDFLVLGDGAPALGTAMSLAFVCTGSVGYVEDAFCAAGFTPSRRDQCLTACLGDVPSVTADELVDTEAGQTMFDAICQ